MLAGIETTCVCTENMKKTTIITSGLIAAAVGTTMLLTRDESEPIAEALAPLPPGLVALAIIRTNQNRVVLSWQPEAGSKDYLQSRQSFSGYDWQQVQGATSPPVLLSATGQVQLFRLVRNPPPAPTGVRVHFNGAMPSTIKVDWVNNCSNCDAVTIDRATGRLIWTQLAQLPASATNYTDGSAPHISTNSNFYRIRSSKNGVFSLN